MEQFTFYDLYYDAIGQLPDDEAGKFIKRLCNFAMYDTEDEPSKYELSNVLWEAILPTLKKAVEIERAGKIPYYLNRNMKHFAFNSSYANMIRAMTNNKNAGIYVKAVCEYMFNEKTPDGLPDELRGAFNIFKKTFDLTKTRSECGKKGGQAKKKPITLAKNTGGLPRYNGKFA